MPGVIGHLKNPSVAEVEELAGAAESAGARWLGLADAFWWRDVWVLLTVAAGGHQPLGARPGHDQPVPAAPVPDRRRLATLQELAGPRVFLGLAAGGSEARLAAKVDRRDAPARTAALIELVRAVAAGLPLDPDSGRRLDMPLVSLPVLVAGGHDGMLRTAGRHADRALIWATAGSDLGRVSDVIGDERRRPVRRRARGGVGAAHGAPGRPRGRRHATSPSTPCSTPGPACSSDGGSTVTSWSASGAPSWRGTAAQRAVWCPTPYWQTSCSAAPMPTRRRWPSRGRAAGVTSIAVPVFSVATVEARVLGRGRGGRPRSAAIVRQYGDVDADDD